MDAETGVFVRQAAKLVVLDPDDRILLLRYPRDDEDGRPFWTVPGGGLKPGETHVEAAARELGEETGIVADVGRAVWWRTDWFEHGGATCRHEEQHFLVRVAEAVPIDAPGPEPAEPILAARWWTLEELEATSDAIFPRRLPALLRDLLANGPPTVPVDAGT